MRLGWFLAASLFVVVAPSVLGDEASTPFREGRLAATTRFDIAALNVTFPVSSFDAMQCRSAGHVDLLVDQGSFRFREESNQAGCAEVRARLDVPRGATSFNLRFLADRRIAASVNPGEGILPVSQVQTVRFYDESGERFREEDYFDQASGEETVPQSFDILVQVPKSVSRITVGWWFYDNAAHPNTEDAPSPGVAFAGTVREATAVFEAVLVDEASALFTDLGGVVANGVVELRGQIDLGVTLDEVVARETWILLELDPAYTVERLVLPNGTTVPGRDLGHSTDGRGRTVTLGPLPTGAAGTYSFYTLATAPVPPPPVTAPARIEVFAYAALVGPGLFWLVATWSSAHHWQRHEPSQQVTAAGIIVLVAMFGLAYVLVVASVAWRSGFDHLATLPITTRG